MPRLVGLIKSWEYLEDLWDVFSDRVLEFYLFFLCQEFHSRMSKGMYEKIFLRKFRRTQAIMCKHHTLLTNTAKQNKIEFGSIVN